MSTTVVPLTAIEQGKPMSRVDGRLKVTGAATYSAEFVTPNLAHGFLVMSTIAKGTIKKIDISEAEKAPGVLRVLTYLNAPKIKKAKSMNPMNGIVLEERLPFADDKIHYGGQYVAVVVADTFEQARSAADLVRISYAAEKPAQHKEEVPNTIKHPKTNQGEKIQAKKGKVDETLNDASLIKIKQTYTTPTETHNPMEASATIATWDDKDHLTLHETTQYVKGVQNTMAKAFGLKADNVRVICPFVGGAFGCKGPLWPHTLVAAMAAKEVGRPVKIELSRHQMFSGVGHRSPTLQNITLAASHDGKLQAIRHYSENPSSTVGAWTEAAAWAASSVMYASPAIEYGHTVFEVNIAQPSFMRAPGECPGTYALECAMDELAYALKMDPVQLRLTNDTPNHPIKEVPFSTRHLKECYETGAEKFGWKDRKPEPRSMRDGHLLVGWGVATATYPGYKRSAKARILFRANGTALVRCASHDLGTGAYTVFTQISADAIGISADKVKVEIGDSALPDGPVAGGSNSTATVGSAISAAAQLLHAKLARFAIAAGDSPLFNRKENDIAMLESGRLTSRSDPTKFDTFADIMKRANLEKLEVEGELGMEMNKKVAFQSFGAHFCEVKIDPDLPLVRVTRVVSVMDCGRVINAKTGRSQILGGVVMGIGMALEEETIYDPKNAMPVNRNLAEYHVPVNADIHGLEVHFVGTPDLTFNPMGARGMGEIGITGISAAIANAVYHATGKRVRDLPITLDKLI